MMFSMRIVNSDFYLADPIRDLDVCHSTLREKSENSSACKVPVIRIYGATPGGQKTCLHVHGVFPYIYVPYDGTQPTDKYLKQFATSVDFAVQVALGRASSSRQHVYDISVVKGIPYYGYHEGEREFLKIVLHNPFLVTRIVSLLQNGAIMKKVFQPHEAHIPYLLQFFMDYNLYGMNLLHASSVKFRSPVRILDGETGAITSSTQTKLRFNSPQSTPRTLAGSGPQIWNEDTVSRDSVLGSDVERLSICELEVDVLASDILNRLEIGVNVGTNPGLAAIWEDEQQRRREANESSQISAPPTQERGFVEETETEKKFKERIKEIIEERDVLIQSQVERLGREAMSPQELASFQDSISSMAASQKDKAGDISLDANALLELLSQPVDESAAAGPSEVVNEDEPVVNQSIVQEVVEASQRSFSQDLSSSLDKEMVDILTSLAEEASQPASQKTALSQSILLDQGDVPCDDDQEANNDEELSEADESIMMSQRVWDDIEEQSAETGDEQVTDAQEIETASQRASQYDLEGMSDTWIGSFLGGDIPQLDGAGDDDSDGIEDFKIRRGKGRKGKSRKRSDQADNTSNKTDTSTPSENSQRRPADLKASEKIMEREKTEKSAESLGVDVWPQKARAFRTYSKKNTMPVLKSKRSLPLNEEEKTGEKDEERLTLVKDVKEKGEEEGSKDEFRLILSDSSDSEDNITKEANLGSKQNEAVEVQKKLSLKDAKIRKRNPSSPRKSKIESTSGECSTPVMTKYFHSPKKNSKGTRRQDEESSSSVENSSGSSKIFDAHSPTEVLSHCSKQYEGFSRKRTLRKRKLTAVDTKDRNPSQGMTLRRRNQATDLEMSLSVVSDAMTNVRVPLDDVSCTPILSSKFDEAQKRLRKRRENSRENFTLVSQRLSSPAREERLSETRSPVRARKNEKSPLSKTRSSPKWKEERMKKYGTLPVVIEKSPKKNITADTAVPDSASSIETKCLPTEQSSANLQSQVESSLHLSQISRESHLGTGRASSRSRARVSGLFSSASRTVATPAAGGNKEMSRPVQVSSRGLPLKTVNKSKGKSCSEKGRPLSLQGKGLKRKLKVDTEKDIQSTTPKNLTGMGKKRKLSLTLKIDKSRSDLREGDASEPNVTSNENCEEHKSVCEVKEDIGNTQQVGLKTESKETLLRCDSKNDFSLNRTLSDEIICIPSSPGDSDSNDEGRSSAVIAESTSFPVSTKTSDKSDDKSTTITTTSISGESKHKVADTVNDLQLVSHGSYCPKEKDTELLANALFNMSFPSPLPCVEECSSPPRPSSPWDVKHNTSDRENEHNVLQEQECFSVNSSIVEEEDENKASDLVKLERIPASSFRQVHQPVYFSPADFHLREKSSLLQMRPELGETQVQFDSMECSEANERRQIESESMEIENGIDCFNNMVDKQEKASESRVPFDTSKTGNKINLSTNIECSSKDGSNIKRTDYESNSECAILEDEIQGQNIELNRPVEMKSCKSEKAHLMQTSGTGKTEHEEQNSTISDEREFVLKLSIAEENSTDHQKLVQSHENFSGMEISVEEQNQTQEITSESPRDGITTASPQQPDDQSKNQICSTQSEQSVSCRSSLENGRGSPKDVIAIEPLKRPPTSEELIRSLKDYGLPQCRYQKPFCSNPDDIPACPREVGGRVLRIESKQVSNLPEFESSGSLQGLKHWRFVLSSVRESSIRDICHAVENTTDIDKNLQLKIALMGDGDVVITPCRGPPAPEAVMAWARDKLAKRGLKTQGTEPALKTSEPREPGTSSDSKNLENVEKIKLSVQSKTDSDGFNAPKINPEQAIPVIPTPNRPLQEARASSRDGDFAEDVDNKHKALNEAERGQKMDVMELSDSSSSVEMTSPCSLFSPNEGKVFTFASETSKEIKQSKSVKDTNVEKALTDTQPMDIDKPQDVVTSETSFVTVTHSPDGTPRQCPSTTNQPLSPVLQSQSPVFAAPTAAPYHSTPVATKLVYGVQSPRCTPISETVKAKRLETNAQTSRKIDLRHQASSDQTHSMRQQLLASQFKFVTPGSQPRRVMPWSSQIEGPSPNNTYGFKVPQLNLQDAKALHEVQHLTLFSLELHVRTRRDLKPDPEFDPICAIFYYIQTDTPLPSGKNKITGIICVDSESFKICSSNENKDRSVSKNDITASSLTSTDAMASTSTVNTSVLTTAAQKTSTSHLRPLLSRSGVTDHEIQYVAEEKDLFTALIRIIRKWDPDILIGYEVQMFSWGFLLERALTFEIDLCSWLSRVKGSSTACNMDAEKDRWGAAHTSEIKIAGRIILNVWRLMRHEVTLNSYSFENVAFHVLHERIPLYTFRTLSDWWDHRTSLNRWRTVDHYVRRCRGNVRILESVDFIGRTSELARLFGILFYSVISRGSQYRVESMMLRIAKPMNYIAVSPSVEQRGLMRAPETIPLVMEPESRFYSDPVLVLDFQSLYPSMIIAYNYCYSTCLGRVSCLSEYGEFKFGATSLCVPPSLLKKLEGDIHVCPSGVAFVKSNVRRGILPSMLDEILKTRIMVKTSMKKWKSDKSLGRMLDARQLGLKLIANVTFGYTSAHFSGRMPCVEIGDSIVRKARETLERAIDLVNNTPRWGARVVYGDTDSLFVLLKGATKEQAFDIGKDIVDTVTAMNPKPVKLKFEKVYLPCVLQTKKRYVGYMYETLDQKEPVFDAKGIETVRRDSCPAVAKILEKSLRILFETRDLSLIKKFVQRQCTKLMEERASLQDFTFAKEYRGMKNYKPGACVPALELTRRMLREDRRSEPRVGERVPYVVVYGSPGLPLIQLVRRPHEVLQDPGLRLNASYYITKQILPPLNRAFSLIGLDVFTWYAELPRVVRVVQMPTEPGERKKGTISQYFSTMTCPVCQELTPTDLCNKCRARPQLSAVTLTTRMRNWERTHQHLSEICYSCCGSRDTKLCCVSLDCPVFYKLVLCTRDLKLSQHLRRILESL